MQSVQLKLVANFAETQFRLVQAAVSGCHVTRQRIGRFIQFFRQVVADQANSASGWSSDSKSNTVAAMVLSGRVIGREDRQVVDDRLNDEFGCLISSSDAETAIMMATRQSWVNGCGSLAMMASFKGVLVLTFVLCVLTAPGKRARVAVTRDHS